MLNERMRLTQKEFKVLYEKSKLRNVELVEGKVRILSRVHYERHGAPHHKLIHGQVYTNRVLPMLRVLLI